MDSVIQKILELRATIPATRSVLVGLSGIDGSGKGYVAAQLEARLALHGATPAILNVDGWLNLPEKRFSRSAPAEHFYENAIRLDEFFTQLVIPLRDRRSVYLVADFAEEAASQYRKHTYDFKDVSVMVVPAQRSPRRARCYPPPPGPRQGGQSLATIHGGGLVEWRG